MGAERRVPFRGRHHPDGVSIAERHESSGTSVDRYLGPSRFRAAGAAAGEWAKLRWSTLRRCSRPNAMPLGREQREPSF